MKFCQHCAGPVQHLVPEGDHRLRHYCPACDVVFYQNPRNVVGAVPVSDDGRILLCKRGIEPRLGKWTLPAGFMENGESTHQGAARETMEEAGARIAFDEHALYTLFNLPRIDQVYLFFRARIVSMDCGFTEETVAVQLFGENEIPWSEIAFPVVSITLEQYFEDLRTQCFPVRMFDVVRNGERIDKSLISVSPPDLRSEAR